MEVLISTLCGVMIAMAIFLVVAVLMQSGKDNRLSGTIAGGAETFFGKTKGKTIDRVLSKITTVVAIIFVVMVLLVYVLQSATGKLGTSSTGSSSSGSSSSGSSAGQSQTTTAEPETTPVTAPETESATGEGQTTTTDPDPAV